MNDYFYTRAEIDLEALRKNYECIKGYAKGTPIMCVIKADAYGHGAIRCAEVLYNAGCRCFAVANVAEALHVRDTVKDSDIIILGPSPAEAANVMADNNIIQSVSSLEYAKMLSANLSSDKILNVHIKLDTGMNRIGFACNDYGINEVIQACALPGLNATGLFSHLACADEPDCSMTKEQFTLFKNTEQILSEKGITFKTRHICNSAATMYNPEMHLDLLRCGIILYGLNPSYKARGMGLEPVMTLKTRVTHVHNIKKGDSVGYGATFTAEGDMKIATLPIGYDDGFIRAYSNSGYVLIGDHKCRIIGRICMDQCMVDVSGTDISIGDDVEIFGKNNSIDVFAKSANTINYECVCLVSKRVPRIY